MTPFALHEPSAGKSIQLLLHDALAVTTTLVRSDDMTEQVRAASTNQHAFDE